MDEKERTAGFVAGRGYSQADWDDVADNPEWAEQDFRNARPFAEVFPELAESIRRGRGRPKSARPKQAVSLRLDPEVLEKFRATGKGWQSRINQVLRDAKI